MEILSCNQYNAETAPWAAASIYELAVYGEGESGDSDETTEIPIQTASGRDESYAQELDGAWQFGGRLLSASAALNADRSNWQSVTIPHTWNAVDADDGGGNYDRTVYWYHKEFTVTQEMQGKRIYLEFLGVNTKADASSVPGGTLVTLTATPDQGYYLKEWRVLSGTVTIQNNRFIMPDEDVVIQAVFEEGLSDANIPGDVNRDGIVDVLDVMTLAQIVVGKTSPAEGVSQEVMDLNGDHSVNVLDVMCLAQIAAGRLQ